MTIRINDKLIGAVPEEISVNTIEISPESGDGILVGGDYGWRDITSAVTIDTDKQSNKPIFVQYGTTTIYQYQFDTIGQEAFQMFHVPHDWVPGTDIYIHAHWSTADIANGNDVVWGFDALWAKRDLDSLSGDSIFTDVSGASSAIGMQHLVHEVALTSDSASIPNTVDTANVEVDGIFLVRTHLKGNTCGQDPFLHTVDLHYQSSNIGTKNKVSNFYT